ncbi:tumor protein p53-inducible protein 11 isoform X10 [Octopus bimaculoides]|uniref:tumor protein p53-inducible protein 11 isoform X10 n=1 Tax=Octopus bimaculoides TaxID=37653 RepID=UPI0022E7409A|nr:tumor protein p53-inducible protein 11 isoform X10 [Octopus bimaculoides]
MAMDQVFGRDKSSTPLGNENEKKGNSLKLKHSSGDLHSRLKSRKLLGVGETDDGDIHRSKLSQILGHSDQLYVRLPSGLRVWQFTLALVFTVIAVWALVFPQHLYETAFEAVEGQCLTLPVRFYGAALLSLSWLFWSTLHAIDRDVIKTALITSILYFFAHVLGALLLRNSLMPLLPCKQIQV